MRFLLSLSVGLLALSPAAAGQVDPLKVSRQDFTRNADPALWVGLTVEQRGAVDGNVSWRLWRISNRNRPKGPLWVVPHDDENGAFSAGLRAVRRWGGVMIAVDSGQDDRSRSARHVMSADGRPLDPNRTFTSNYPNYVAAVLADLGRPARPIIALHTNAAGFDPRLAGCGNPPPAAGSGSISVKLCNTRYTPRPARSASWPWDDEDSVILSPYRDGKSPGEGWCAKRLLRGNFNLTFERVGTSDGSLSNYAILYGLDYLNFETRDRGSDPAGIALARDRLSAMIDAAMELCLGRRHRNR